MPQAVQSPPAEPNQAPQTSSPTTRLLVSLLIGSPLGGVLLVTALTHTSSPFAWWEWAIIGFVLVGAMVVSVLLDPQVRRGAIGRTRMGLCLGAVGLLAGVIAAPLLLLPEKSAWFFLCAVGELPFSVGVAAAFTVGGQGSWREAWESALAASIPLVIGFLASLIWGAIAVSNTPFTGGMGAFVCLGGLVVLVLGLGLVAVGGIFGRFLHQQLLYRA